MEPKQGNSFFRPLIKGMKKALGNFYLPIGLSSLYESHTDTAKVVYMLWFVKTFLDENPLYRKEIVDSKVENFTAVAGWILKLIQSIIQNYEYLKPSLSIKKFSEWNYAFYHKKSINPKLRKLQVDGLLGPYPTRWIWA